MQVPTRSLMGHLEVAGVVERKEPERDDSGSSWHTIMESCDVSIGELFMGLGAKGEDSSLVLMGSQRLGGVECGVLILMFVDDLGGVIVDSSTVLVIDTRFLQFVLWVFSNGGLWCKTTNSIDVNLWMMINWCGVPAAFWIGSGIGAIAYRRFILIPNCDDDQFLFSTRGLPSPVSWLGCHTKRVIAAMELWIANADLQQVPAIKSDFGGL
ncbi:hypothetical protein Tco_0243504 [Tanacetum coccineum]